MIDEFNRQTDFEYERIRDFIVLHYKASERYDSAFWRQCRDMPIPDSLVQKIELFKDAGLIFREHEELFTEVGWLQVLVGQGVEPQRYHPLADAVAEKDLAEYMATLEALIAREVAQMPTHEAFIAQNCAARTPA
jgi:tryptophan halogenase